MVERKRSQFGERTPLSQIVNVHVKRQTILEAIHQTRIHHEIHTAVSEFSALFAVFLDDGAFVFLRQGLSFSGGKEVVCAEIVYLGSHSVFFELRCIEGKALFGIFGGVSLRAGELKQTVVGLRIHHVVLNFHDLTFGGAHERGSLVTTAEVFAGLSRHAFHILLAVHRLRVHCGESREAIAAVYVQTLCNRAESVCSIEVAAIFHVVSHAPTQFFRLGIVGIVPICAPELVEVVNVSAFSTKHFTENTVLRHVEGVEFVVVVAAVFEDHAVLARFLREVDQLPALIEVHSRGNFDRGVFSVFESTLGYGEMVVPIRGNIDEIYVRTGTNCFVALCAVVNVGRSETFLAEFLLALLCSFAFVVAECHNLHTGDVGETDYCPGAAHAETYKGHTYRFHLGDSETENVLLSGSTLRSCGHDGALIPVPVAGLRILGGGLSRCARKEQSRKRSCQ